MTKTQASLLGQIYCDALNVRFSVTFRFQFVLSKDARDLPDFVARPFAGRTLHTHEALPVTELTDRDGTPLGLILGYATLDGAVLTNTHALDLSANDKTLPAKLEAWVAYLGGRYLVFTDLPKQKRRKIYPDPAGSLGLVYDPQSGLIASSLLLCLEREIAPDPDSRPDDELLANRGLRQLLPQFNRKTPVGGAGFGSTIDRHVRRLLANRALDIDTLKEHRFWSPSTDMPHLTPEDAAEIIVSEMRNMMQAFCTLGPGYFAISGGHDSRMLLACAPDLTKTDMQLYAYATNWIGTLDVRVSEVLAETLGRPFFGQIAEDGPKGTFIAHRKVAERTRHRFALGSGLAHLGDHWWQRGYARRLDQGTFWLRGNFLEIITARVWPRHNLTPSDEMLHALSNTRVALGDEADVARKLAQLEDWRNDLPMDAERHLHDLTYLDLTLAPAQGMFYGFSSHTYLAPGNNRRIFEAAMMVPWQDRKRGKLYDAIMRRANPDLLQVPLVGQATHGARKLGIPARDFLEQKIADLRKENA